MSRFARALAVVIAALLVLWLGGAWWLASLTVHPPWHVHRTPEQGLWMGWEEEPTFWMGIHTDPRHDHALDYRDVEFPAEDGSTLRGWFVPAASERERIVVAVHGGGGDRRDWLRHVPVFHGAGWPVLLFDTREHGISDGRGLGTSFGVREHRDVLSAVAWAHDQGFAKVAAVGTSVGGASVLLAAAASPAIDVVISENPFKTIEALLSDQEYQPIPAAILWPLRPMVRFKTYGSSPQPIDVVDRIAPRPILFIHGSADLTVPAHHSETLHRRAREPKELWIAEGAGHTESFNRYPEEYTRRVRAFLDRHLR